MQDQHPLSPEERRKEQAAEAAAVGPEVAEAHHPKPGAWEVVKRVAIGVYNDGFIHAGNLAFLSLLALFPFFILATAIAKLLGQSRTVIAGAQHVERDVQSFARNRAPMISRTMMINPPMNTSAAAATLFMPRAYQRQNTESKIEALRLAIGRGARLSRS